MGHNRYPKHDSALEIFNNDDTDHSTHTALQKCVYAVAASRLEKYTSTVELGAALHSQSSKPAVKTSVIQIDRLCHKAECC